MRVEAWHILASRLYRNDRSMLQVKKSMSSLCTKVPSQDED